MAPIHLRLYHSAFSIISKINLQKLEKISSDSGWQQMWWVFSPWGFMDPHLKTAEEKEGTSVLTQRKILTQFSLVFIDPNCASHGHIPGPPTTLVWPGAWDGQGYSDKLQAWTLGMGGVPVHARVQLFVAPRAIARQAPLSTEFSRQECWSGLPCPPPGDLPNSGIKPEFLASPLFAGRFFPTLPPRKPGGGVAGTQNWRTSQGGRKGVGGWDTTQNTHHVVQIQKDILNFRATSLHQHYLTGTNRYYIWINVFALLFFQKSFRLIALFALHNSNSH